jgi:hypothetical protein
MDVRIIKKGYNSMGEMFCASNIRDNSPSPLKKMDEY